MKLNCTCVIRQTLTLLKDLNWPTTRTYTPSRQDDLISVSSCDSLVGEEGRGEEGERERKGGEGGREGGRGGKGRKSFMMKEHQD